MLTPSLDNSTASPRRWSADELIPFGKYLLLNKINSGASAAVYRAKIRGEAGFERLVAVKRILPHMAGDPEFVNTFVREAKTAARLNHTNICPIYELGKVGESLYMAMEWIAGKDLGAITRRLHRADEVMPPIIGAWIAKCLCDALDYAHTLKDARGKPAGIIHRDLSPTNIVLSYEGQVKLIDFGLAKAVGRAQQTNVDALKKKLGYMSPELVKGKAPDARSDVFGVGVCLYEMVTARRLFAGKDDMATLKMVSNASVPPPSALVEDAPEELENIIMHALERDPDKRWQTAGEMSQALNAFITQNDPMFGTRQLGEYMVAHFRQDMESEQQRVNELLEASHDPAVLEERRRFFASPAGAAAMAKAEVARRMSTEPPSALTDSGRPISSVLAAQNVPRAPALPRIALRAGVSSHPPPAASGGASAGKGKGNGAGATFEDEATNFFDPAALAAQVTEAAPEPPADDEATAFFDGQAHARAIEAALHADAPQAPVVAEPRSAVRLEGLAPTVELAEAGDALGYSAEKTEFLAGDALSDVVVDEQVEAPARGQAGQVSQAGQAGQGGQGGFGDEEATHIFFNKEDGTGIPGLLAEELDAAAPRLSPVPKVTFQAQSAAAVSAPQPAAAAPASAPQAPARPRPAQARPPGRRGPTTGERARVTTLEMTIPRRRDRLSGVLLFLGLGLLALAIAGLIAKTPVGIALGLRRASAGAIEIRTTPAVAAAVKLDGVYRGQTPLRMDGVRAGRRVLELQADGYQPVERAVDLSGGTTAMVDIALTPRPAAAVAAPPPAAAAVAPPTGAAAAPPPTAAGSAAPAAPVAGH